MSTSQNIYAIKDRAPEFPCWIYNSSDAEWVHFQNPTIKNDDWDRYGWTHWTASTDKPSGEPNPSSPASPSPVAGLPTPETTATIATGNRQRWKAEQLLQDKCADLERRLTAARAEVERLTLVCQEQLAKLEEIHALRAQLATAKEEADKHYAEKTALYPVIDSLRSDLATAKEALEDEQQRYAAFKLHTQGVIDENNALRSDLAKANAAVEEAKRRDEFNFAILKDAHAKLQMTEDQSYSLIPSEIEEWICSHNRFKHAANELRQQLTAQQSVPPLAGIGTKETPPAIAKAINERLFDLIDSTPVPPEARAVEATETFAQKTYGTYDRYLINEFRWVCEYAHESIKAGNTKPIRGLEALLSKVLAAVAHLPELEDEPPTQSQIMLTGEPVEMSCEVKPSDFTQRTCFPPGEGDLLEVIEEMDRIHDDIMNNGPRCTCGSGDEWCVRCGKSSKLSRLAHSAILKHAPARPTAAREDTELRSLVDRLREEFVNLHTEAISRRDNGLPENWSRYENDRSYYEGVIEEIDAAMQQGGKTP